MKLINVWTDGSCISNGTDSAICGIGVYYESEEHNNVSTRLPDGKQTNNRAELCAILYALCTNKGDNSIRIITDSDYAIKCITRYKNKWELNGWKTSQGKDVEWSNIIKYICTLIDQRKKRGGMTEFQHIRGHSGNVGNENADKLAHDASTNGVISNKVLFLAFRCNVPFS